MAADMQMRQIRVGGGVERMLLELYRAVRIASASIT